MRKQKYSLDVDPFGIHQKIIEEVPEDSNVLEIGCASGYITEILKQNGCKVVGVEINRKDALIAKRFCTRLIIGDIEDKNVLDRIRSKKFEVIILADVLEHLQNPEAVLSDINKRLKPEGILLISVPNIAFLTNRLLHLLGVFDYSEWGIMDRTHLRFFTQKTLQQMIQSSGLRVVKFDYVGNFTQLPFYMQTLHPIVQQRRWWRKIEQKITGFWPQGLSVQFFIICKSR